MFLSMFLFFLRFQPGFSSKKSSYKKKKVLSQFPLLPSIPCSSVAKSVCRRTCKRSCTGSGLLLRLRCRCRSSIRGGASEFDRIRSLRKKEQAINRRRTTWLSCARDAWWLSMQVANYLGFRNRVGNHVVVFLSAGGGTRKCQVILKLE